MNRLDVSRIILETSSYDDMKQGNTVSITGDGGNAWGYYGPAYKKLAPRLVTYTPYAEKYEELLKLKDDVLKLKDYIELKTGVYKPELKVDSNGIVKKLNPIRYKDRLKKVMDRK